MSHQNIDVNKNYINKSESQEFPKISFYGIEKVIGVAKKDYANDDRNLNEINLDYADGEKYWKCIPLKIIRQAKKMKNQRPKLRKKLKMLKKPEFILDGVDKYAYFQYIKLIDEYKK